MRSVPALAAFAITLANLAPIQIAAAPLADGVTAIANGDYAGAMAVLTPLAEGGDILASRMLGGLYLGGIGVAQDCAKGKELLLRAANAGDARAQYLLGKAFGTEVCQRIDIKIAYGWYKKAAEGHDPDAAFTVGLFLNEGRVAKRDLGAAYYWYVVSVHEFQNVISKTDVSPDDKSLRNMRAAINNIAVLDASMSDAERSRVKELLLSGSDEAFDLDCSGVSVKAGSVVTSLGLKPATFHERFRIDPKVAIYCQGKCEIKLPLSAVDADSVTILDRPSSPPGSGREYERIDLHTGAYSKREKTALLEVNTTAQCSRTQFSGFPAGGVLVRPISK